MKVKKVWKFATGQPIPEGAVYLATIKQTEQELFDSSDEKPTANRYWERCWFVWHYFLVEVEENL